MFQRAGRGSFRCFRLERFEEFVVCQRTPWCQSRQKVWKASLGWIPAQVWRYVRKSRWNCYIRGVHRIIWRTVYCYTQWRGVYRNVVFGINDNWDCGAYRQRQKKDQINSTKTQQSDIGQSTCYDESRFWNKKLVYALRQRQDRQNDSQRTQHILPRNWCTFGKEINHTPNETVWRRRQSVDITIRV